ncbi:CYTH domain-containing protein [Pinirhizobacter sp.]|jgi:adenylate cyclase|uniref:CYTH domain-containing protein n=1 Tax=Pinirhizobacter sp. TaxID=2950432 RepID=UPI002F407618
MGKEIERKFLLAGGGWREGIESSTPIAQGYLMGVAALMAGHARASVRVRIAGNEAWLNIKSSVRGIERAEFEYPIPMADARDMLDTLCDGKVEKTRHHVHVDGTLFEIDEFAGANHGLVVAEVELDHAGEAIPHPPWLGREVSDERRYYNVFLIDHPFTQWTQAERSGEAMAC